MPIPLLVTTHEDSPIQRLPDDLLSRILQSVAIIRSDDNQFDHALVCKHWHDIACRVRDQIRIPLNSFSTPSHVLQQLSSIPRLRKIVISPFSMTHVPDSILFRIADTCPDLTELYIGAMDRAYCWHSFSEDALSSLFSKCTRLEDLHLYCKDYIEAIPPSIGRLASLTSLHLVARGVKLLPDTFTSLQSLRRLVLDMSKLEDLPRDIRKMTLLESLHLEKCYKLESLPESLSQLAGFTRLSISDCDSLQLPGSLTSLSFLEIRNHDMYSTLLLPEGLGKLPALETLLVDTVEDLTPDLLESIGQLQRLKLLSLTDYSGVVTLPRSLSLPTSLTGLNLEVKTLSVLPDDIGLLPKLQSLNLKETYGAEGLSLTSLPDSITLATALQTLSLERLRNLTSLPEDFGQLAALETLRMADLPELTHLPESFGNLPNLQDLKIDDCPRLQQLPESFGNLPNLQDLKIDDCPRLQQLPEGMGSDLISLRHLRLLCCTALTHLPPSFSCLTSLETLRILLADSFRGELPEGFGGLRSLKKLSLCAMRHLSALPASISGLVALTSLLVSSCPEINELPADIGRLGALEELKISKLDGLDSLPQSLVELPRLRVLVVRKCSRLKTILGDEAVRGVEQGQGAGAAAASSVSGGCSSSSNSNSASSSSSSSSSSAISSCSNSNSTKSSSSKSNSASSSSSNSSSASSSSSNNNGASSSSSSNSASGSSSSSSNSARGSSSSSSNSTIASSRSDIGPLLPSLQSLELENLPFESLGPSLGLLSSLTALELSYMEHLSSLPVSISSLSQLQRLEIWNLEKLEALPENLGQLSCLSSLVLGFLDSLCELPDSLGQLKKLQTLKILFCSNLVRLPDSFPNLACLKRCTLQAVGISSIPYDFGKLSSLRFLELESLPNLQSLPESFLQLPRLEALDLVDCEQLSEIPPALLAMPMERGFKIRGCPSRLRSDGELFRLLDGGGWKSFFQEESDGSEDGDESWDIREGEDEGGSDKEDEDDGEEGEGGVGVRGGRMVKN
ncbi:hypothetical protein CLOM_g21956 [Closterium sp. NIES-68]|nr:hypothetical protein CLOM_g21956 [Closterium sp. NIES-68]GJP75132.1 hypothetical protein CLOP_g5618 [Closterium sp. NIES-67]